jgi:alkylated DNA repair dioxygenase AlkB
MTSKYFQYHSKFIENGTEIFDELLPILEKRAQVRSITMYDKVVDLPRQSCLYMISDAAAEQLRRDYYSNTPIYTDPPNILKKIQERLETEFPFKFDYVLCHIYRNGLDHIGYHNDSEATHTEVMSISLSDSETKRKFRLRPKDWTKGYEHEISLNSGDLVHMFGPRDTQQGCQQVLKHSLIKEGGKRGAALHKRINLTFRQIQ